MKLLDNKYAIGCIVQWYEVEIYETYIQSLINALENIENKDNVIVDICFYLSQNLETLDKSKISMKDILNRFRDSENLLIENGINCNVEYYMDDKIYTIADYRRDFNDEYCEKVDVLMWGETDSLIPRQNFEVLDLLHTNNVSQGIYKYLAFFGTCKMWDKSWECIEHNDFTDKPFIDIDTEDTEHWWSLRYNMSIDEMNTINDKVEELDVRVVNPYKFNGCGLVISSDVIKSGVNIPKSVMLVHEDTAFQNSLIKMFDGSIPQFIFKNILLVHNRKHTKKREYVLGEDVNETNPGVKRESNDWYKAVWKFDNEHAWKGFQQGKIYTWDDVFDKKNDV
tara:strand:- start:1615 stop:2628 length:1014 start_codon:yes stop_codon:yes gene_type:complete